MADFIDSSINNEITKLSGNNTSNIIQIPLLVLIFIFAAAYIILILTRKTLRANKLIWPNVNVCLATALFSLNQLIFTIIRLKNLTDILLTCRSQGYLINMVACQIMYSHCVSSFYRLLTIRYFNKPLFRSCRWLLSGIGVGWIVGLVAALPYLFYDGFACSSSTQEEFLKPYSCIITALIPISIVAICNLSIFWYIHKSSQRIHDINNNQNNNNISRKRDLHICIIMLLTFCIFVIGWIPIFFEQLFTNNESELSKDVSSYFRILLPVCLLGDMILLIYAYQPVRQLIRAAFRCNGVIPCAIT